MEQSSLGSGQNLPEHAPASGLGGGEGSRGGSGWGGLLMGDGIEGFGKDINKVKVDVLILVVMGRQVAR